jgi:hypothetical protein
MVSVTRGGVKRGGSAATSLLSPQKDQGCSEA